MRALRLVGPGEDGTSLIVEAVEAGSLEGERFTLSLDDRLRTMATAQPDEQTETPESTPAESSGPVPTPREIQVRVRSGESAQAVADEAGIPLERVMRFAFPVLQERVRVTDEARRARARRGGDGLLVPFGELIDSRLGRHGVDPASVRWDAYRREDGGWTVTSKISAHEREVLAKFSFALLNRTVSALDDIAADLLSDRPVQALLPPPPAPEPVAESAEWAPDWDAPPPPRLTAVPNPAGADVPARQQETGAAVRPPSRRQKAHTRPVPIHAEDELFDQDAFEQQPWHEQPLPFESGRAKATTSIPPRHLAQRPEDEALAGAGSDTVIPAQPETGSAAPEPAERELPGSPGFVQQGFVQQGFEQQGFEQPDFVQQSFEQPDFEQPDFVQQSFEQPDFVPPEELFTPASTGRGNTATATPAADEQSGSAEAGADDAASDSDLVSARAGGSEQGKRGRRSGDKPRMPSWDDILLGVRHKSD